MCPEVAWQDGYDASCGHGQHWDYLQPPGKWIHYDEKCLSLEKPGEIYMQPWPWALVTSHVRRGTQGAAGRDSWHTIHLAMWSSTLASILGYHT